MCIVDRRCSIHSCNLTGIYRNDITGFCQKHRKISGLIRQLRRKAVIVSKMFFYGKQIVSHTLIQWKVAVIFLQECQYAVCILYDFSMIQDPYNTQNYS